MMKYVLCLLAALVGLGGCGALDVSDPTQVEDADIGNSTGADLMRRMAITNFAEAVSAGVLASGMMADEFFPDPESLEFSDLSALDRRQSESYEELVDAGNVSVYHYALWNYARRAVAGAIPRLREFMPEPRRSVYVGQMLAMRGYVTLYMAEDLCSGFPIHDLVNYSLIYGPPQTTTEALERALADFDSAVTAAADSARILNLARVGRARTLLALGRFAEAGAGLTDVPTSYVANAEFRSSGVSTQPNGLVFYGYQHRSVSNQEGGNGLDYVTANDPRVTTTLLALAYDGVTELRGIGKYPDGDASIVVASGIEARLIEAEAALEAGQPGWLTKLNELRTNGAQDGGGVYQPGTGGIAGLAPLTDPGSDNARVDLLFRERAFWLFATGHRLADLRRLVAHYGRSPDAVFPTGAYRTGGTYGEATNIPYPWKQEKPFSPAVTSCASR